MANVCRMGWSPLFCSGDWFPNVAISSIGARAACVCMSTHVTMMVCFGGGHKCIELKHCITLVYSGDLCGYKPQAVAVSCLAESITWHDIAAFGLECHVATSCTGGNVLKH